MKTCDWSNYHQRLAEYRAMTEFEIWMEGYRATCEHGTAHFVGLSRGFDFEDAVRRWYAHPTRATRAAKFFDQQTLSYWGCRLFPTEKEARKAYG